MVSDEMEWTNQAGFFLLMLQMDDPRGQFWHEEVNAFFESYSP